MPFSRFSRALIMEAEQWLNNEDKVEREARLERLRWLASLMPNVEWMLYGTGPISKYLFDEARYCFAYGQYLGSIILGLAFLEVSLAGAFYAVGRNDLERAGIAALSKEALNYGWLSQADYDAIEQVRDYRNPITHFRPPGHDERVEARAFHEGIFAYEVIERDARKVMQTVFHLLLKVVPWAARELPNVQNA
jgi:hypothetical protein